MKHGRVYFFYLSTSLSLSRPHNLCCCLSFYLYASLSALVSIFEFHIFFSFSNSWCKNTKHKNRSHFNRSPWLGTNTQVKCDRLLPFSRALEETFYTTTKHFAPNISLLSSSSCDKRNKTALSTVLYFFLFFLSSFRLIRR